MAGFFPMILIHSDSMDLFENDLKEALKSKSMERLEKILENLDPIPLDTVGTASLLRRYDTKFLLSFDEAIDLLGDLAAHYRVLEIDGSRIFRYENLYFDTSDNFFYLQHHNQNYSRYKIRYRRYVSSDLCFFEVKCKSNKGRTVKNRMKVDAMDMRLSSTSKRFAQMKASDSEKMPVDMLMPKLWTRYHRITMVNRRIKERLTIDLNLSFQSSDASSMETNRLVVAEAKQNGIDINSPFMRCMRDSRTRSTGFSKYCVGVSLLNGHVKSNRFKPRLMALQKYLKER